MVSRIGAGLRLIDRGFFDSSGNFLGGTTTAPTGGATGSPMLRLQGGRVMPIQAQEAEVVPADGDDETLVTFEFDASGLPSGSMEVATRDDAFDALIQGTKVRTHENVRIGVLEPLNRTSEQVCLLVSQIAKDWTAGSKGVKKWEHKLLPQVNIKPLGNTMEQRAFNAYNYSMNLSKSDMLPWTSVNDTEHGTTGAAIITIASDYPIKIQRWTGTGALQTFTMDKKRETGGSMYVAVAKVQQAETTDWTCADESQNLVFVGTPADGAVIVGWWEFPEADIT